MVKLIIFRHGETDANKLGICQARGNYPLNDKGVSQASNLYKQLSGKNFDIILSSPLKRAIQTAQIVNQSSNAIIETLDDLLELNNDYVEGMTYDEFFDKYISIFGSAVVGDDDFLDSKIPYGESRRDVINRWLKVIEYIKENHSSKKLIGIATHYGVMKALKYHHFNDDVEEIENCEYFEIDI